MKYSKTLQFNTERDRPWKYIIIDYPLGHAIKVGNDIVGGFLVRKETWRGGIKVFLMEGIEIEPEFRNKGMARHVVKMLMKNCDLMVGSITEDDCKGFWKRMGAEFCDLPLECFPDNLRATIHTEQPLFFFITQNTEAKELARKVGAELPRLIKEELPKHESN